MSASMDRETAILERMKNNIADAAAVIEGCKALNDNPLSLNINAEVRINRAKELFGKGAAAVVLDGMKQHKDNAEVQVHASQTLMTVSVAGDESIKCLMLMGAGEVIIYAMNKNKMDEKIQSYGCVVLSRLAKNSEENMKLMYMGAAEAILNAMKNHKNEEEVLRTGCAALESLASDNYISEALLIMGAGEAIINSMHDCPLDEFVQKLGCSALKKLAISHQNSLILINQGAGEVVMNAMMQNKDDQDIRIQGCLALNSLICNDEIIAKALQKGLGRILSNVIRDLQAEYAKVLNSGIQEKGTPILMLAKVKVKMLEFEKKKQVERVAELEQRIQDLENDRQTWRNHEREQQFINDFQHKIEELKIKVEKYENNMAIQEQDLRDIEEKKLEDSELRKLKLESYLSSQLGNHDNYISDEIESLFQNQIKSVIDELTKLKNTIMNQTSVYELFLRIERFENVLQGAENTYDRISLHDLKATSDVLLNQCKMIDTLDNQLIDNWTAMNREDLIQKGKERDAMREDVVKRLNKLQESIKMWKSTMHGSTEWEQFPHFATKIRDMRPDSIKNDSFGKLQDQSSKLKSRQMENGMQNEINYQPGDVFAGNDIVHDLINKMEMCKQSASEVFGSSNALNQFIQGSIAKMQTKTDLLMQRRQVIEEELKIIEGELNHLAQGLEFQVEKYLKRGKIKDLETKVKIKDEETKECELHINNLNRDMIEKRRLSSQADVDILEQQMKDAKGKLNMLKLDIEELHESLNKELKGNCIDGNGKCIFPDLILVYSSSISSSSSSSDKSIRIPESLHIKSNRCDMLDQIGDGGFSSVYKMRMKNRGDDSGEQLFAFKQFNILSGSIKNEEIKMIEREIEMLEHVEHDNIVKIIGAIGDPNAKDINNEKMGTGIVMEHCENGSLRSLLNKNTNNNHQQQLLNMDLIIHLLLGAAQGLEYLHNHIPHAIIHGDIKSDNILIDKEYNAKLCDFGISKLQQTTMASTKGGNVVGTLAYKAPETFCGKMECTSDVYSFGCVILEMLTGERPWYELGNETGALLTKMLITKEQHDLSQVRKDAKEELINLMKRCLDYDKDKRPSMNEVRMELEKMMNNAVLIELDDKSDEYNKVGNIFFPGEDKEGSLNRDNYRIVKIDKIRHLFAERRYDAELSNIRSMMCKSKSIDGANENLLFHGTSQTDPMMILNHPDAFMKDYSSQGFYGKGLYFAELARYSNGCYGTDDNGNKYYYRYNIPRTNQYQMLVCSVICGIPEKKYGITASEQTRELSQKDLGTEYHSVYAGPHRPSGAGLGEDDSCMYVLYKDTQVVARYLITYKSTCEIQQLQKR